MGVWAVHAGNQTALAFSKLWTVPAGNQVGLYFESDTPVVVIPPAVTHTGASSGAPWSLSPRRARSVAVRYSRSGRRAASLGMRWQSTQKRLSLSTGFDWSLNPRARASTGSPWLRADSRLGASVGLPWELLERLRGSTGLPWERTSKRLSVSAGVNWLEPPRFQKTTGLPWAHPARLQKSTTTPWLHPDALKLESWLPWERGLKLEPGVRGPGIEPPYVPPDTDGNWNVPPGNRVALALACHWGVPLGNAVRLPFAPYACYTAAPKPKAYVVLNTVTVVRLPERTNIEVESVDIGSAVDNAFHSVSLSLARVSDLDLLVSLSDPKQVEVNINGHVFTALIEDWTKDRAWPGASTKAEGRSVTALLDKPYAPVRSKTNALDRQAQALVDDELDLTGFTADYDTLTWLVPAGSFTYDAQSPVEAMATLANASGAVLQSDPWDQVFHVRPRYPNSPWDWATSAIDKNLLDDYVVTQGYRNSTSGTPVYEVKLPLWPPGTAGKPGRIAPLDLCSFETADGTVLGQCTASRIEVQLEDNALVVWQTVSLEALPAEPKYNSVLVSGQQVGVSDTVQRDGSAGDVRLPQIVDALISTHSVSAERGRNALAGGGDGLAKSNVWRQLSSTVGPGSRYLKGNITAFNSDGSVSVATDDGFAIRARPMPGQTWSLLDGVFVEDGRIVDSAPTLPGTTILV